MNKKTIAFLHHDQPGVVSPWYLISYVRRHWEAQGARIIDIFGVEKYEPADIVVVHVDLSVVPSRYEEFAGRYPKAINRFAGNICKADYLPDLVSKNDSYEGQVVVKSNLNYAGLPELENFLCTANFLQKAARKMKNYLRSPASPPFRSKADYRVFDSVRDVPDGYFTSEYVVQRFQPEMRGDLYVLRRYYFLGEAEIQNVDVSTDALHGSGDHVGFSDEPAPKVVHDLRKRLNLEYGKIDYVIVDGEPRIFDANKTCGIDQELTEPMFRIARRLAVGLD